MAEIPERWKLSYENGTSHSLCNHHKKQVIEELGTAEARIRELESEFDCTDQHLALEREHTAKLNLRIRELEQERDRLPAKWFEDSSLQTWFPLTAEELERTRAQLQAVQNELEELRAWRDSDEDAVITVANEIRHQDEATIAQLQSQLAAVTQERDMLLQKGWLK
jgi:hypothetical protein